MLRTVAHLRLKSGWTLRGYCFTEGANGNGRVFAFPPGRQREEGIERLENVEFVSGVVIPTPIPAGAASSPMDAFEGDGSLESFMEASLLFRELREYGAQWHGIEWGAHEVVVRPPWAAGEAGAGRDWTYHQSIPASLEPEVIVSSDGAQVTFFSYSELGMVALVEHSDRFAGESLEPTRSARLLASAGMGYVY